MKRGVGGAGARKLRAEIVRALGSGPHYDKVRRLARLTNRSYDATFWSVVGAVRGKKRRTTRR